MSVWFTNIAAVIELILELIAAFQKAEVRQLGATLKNAPTPKDKQNIAIAIAKYMYNP